MKHFLPTIILRHKRENIKKCSLQGLEKRDDFLFFTYPHHSLPDLSSYILLSLEGPTLTEEDNNYGLFLLDGTWRYAAQMLQQIKEPHALQHRTLPSAFRTAYPRCQTGCEDPSRGLSSLEALFVAFTITGRNTQGLLDNYYWKEQFLQRNRALL